MITLRAQISFLLISSIVLSCGYLGEDDYSQDEISYDGTYEEAVAGEQYNSFEENPFVSTSQSPTSTFSIDADGASYANSRRFINKFNQLPPPDAVRIEELINYFPFDYPEGASPVTINGEVTPCPWTEGHFLVRLGMKGKSLPTNPPSNFVLLIDVSGSMQYENKLSLLKAGFTSFVDQMTSEDRISIITYAGASKILLSGASGDNKNEILEAIDRLSAGGGTAGAAGIVSAYDLAIENFIDGGNNRVILGTDGDFNVGISSQTELISLIKSKRDEGIYLTVLGVGDGNLNEGMMEQLANNGNGNFEYLDSGDELMKVFRYDFQKFFTIAKDVKVQITFNEANVDQYRLIGYENRLLENHEFENDSTDAGELGASQTVTAVYQIIPKEGINFRRSPVFRFDVRYKDPASNEGFEEWINTYYDGQSFSQSSESMRFCSSVIGFGLLIRNSPYKGTLTWDDVLNWTENAMTFDPNNLRGRHLDLVQNSVTIN